MPVCGGPRESESIGPVIVRIVTQPSAVFVDGWNWKAALLSASICVMLFCVASVPQRAEFLRGGIARGGISNRAGGCWGSMMQELRYARPAWLAGLLVAVVLRASALLLEFGFLKLGGATHIASEGVRRVLQKLT